MASKRDTEQGKSKGREQNALSRRDFVTTGAATGIGAAVLAAPGTALAQASAAPGIEWTHEVDIVICGSGSVGLCAAIRARDLGARVLIVEQNFDAGGKLIHSGGWTSLGGGDALQERDRTGADPDGFGLTAPLIPPEDLEDDPDRLFTDVTDWSVVENTAAPPYRYNDREQHRAWADNTVATRQFLMDNYVRFARIDGTHQGGGMSRARAARAMLKLADATDMRAGTVTLADAGSADEERHSPFNPASGAPGPSATGHGAPGWVEGGFTVARPLEFSAREKGVQFMFNRHMDEIIREEPFSGRVLGIRASYTPRFDPETGQQLQSYWQNGNVDERADTITIRARKAVIIGTGGMQGNVNFRTMFDPRLSEPSIQYGDGLMGPLHADASGILAGMRIGANLAGMLQNYQHRHGSPGLHPILGTRARWDALFPGHPVFKFIKATGINIGDAGWEHLITVNQVGKRFYNEAAIPANIAIAAKYPPGSAGTRKPFTPLDWRNCSIEQIKALYTRSAAADAALAINEGSRPPHYNSGPVWAIFDAAAIERGGWQVRYPYIAEPSDGYVVKADSLAELANLVQGNAHQTMPLKYLEETVARYNGFADAGKDDDFEKPVMHRIDTPPFYAAIVPIAMNDSYGGLRINGRSQVVDVNGEVIPGLYSGGEASGGGAQHGIGRATVHGFIAGTHAANGPAY